MMVVNFTLYTSTSALSIYLSLLLAYYSLIGTDQFQLLVVLLVVVAVDSTIGGSGVDVVFGGADGTSARSSSSSSVGGKSVTVSVDNCFGWRLSIKLCNIITDHSSIC